MDDKWFKKRQKIVGVTAQDIADQMGRSRSIVSHILTGKQKMSLDWAKAFSEVLQVPLDQVLEKAGALPKEQSQQINHSFRNSDATPWQEHTYERANATPIAEHFAGNKPSVNLWRMQSNDMSTLGYLVGDIILVDSDQSERTRHGDTVLAQIYDQKEGTERTIVRQYQPPVLVSGTGDPTGNKVYVVDGNNVVIKGKIIASWRSLEK